MQRRDITLTEVKLAGDGQKTGMISGYGAVFGNLDAYDEVIERGAFKDSLKEWQARGKYPPMLLQHGGGGFFGGDADGLLPVGKWTDMQENSKGLKVEGELFALGTERGQYIYEGLKAGALDGLSIGFRTKQHKTGTKPGEPSRTLLEIDLLELSIVTFPANPKARVTGVKGLTPDQLREMEDALRDAGFSRRDSMKAVSVFRELRQRDADAPGSALRDAVAPDHLATTDDALAAMRRLEAIVAPSAETDAPKRALVALRRLEALF